MANVVPFAFKQGILKAQHDFTTIVAAPGAGGAAQGTPVVGAYRLALYTFNGGTPPFTSASSIYSAVGTEVNNTGSTVNYTAGGAVLSTATVGQTGNFTTVDWSDATWATATISAGFGVLYRYDTNAAANYLVAILDFNGAKSSTNGTFQVAFPTINTGGDAILSITGNP
jgi:hypothetical protein|tara:strand:+ start:63 stop:572 length:510 start_codon:yes stop_codon:yes gene_type:complete